MNALTEEDLRRALAPMRPDPESFRKAVERKLAEREDEDCEAPTSWWRQAAAVLPIDLLTPGGIRTGVPVAVLAKKFGLGGGVGVMALPVVSLAMIALAFVAALRVLLRTGVESGGGRSSANEVLRSWWRTHALHAAGTIAFLALLAWKQPAETVLIVLLLSLAVVTLLVTRLTRAGAATRASVGDFTAEFLGALLGLALILDGLGAGLGSTYVPAYWAPTALFWGCLVCDVFGRWKHDWSPLEKFAGAVLPTALVVGWIAGLAGRVQPVGPELMVSYAESQDLDQDEVIEWQRLGRVGAWLLESELPFERSTARRAIELAWERSRATAKLFDHELSRHVLAAAARVDLLPDDLWRAIASGREARGLLEREGTLSAASHVELLVRSLVRAGLTEAQRDHLARRLAATWPRSEATRALEDMAGIQELSELIGRPLGDERRAQVEQALWQHWRGADPGRAFAAPFASEPRTAGEGRLGDLLYLNATHAAVRLMGRFGVGERIDLARVRAFLVGAATPSIIEVLAPEAWIGLSTQSYHYDAAVALDRLEALPEAQAIVTIKSWQAERVFMATLLLIALCLFATVWAGIRGTSPTPRR
jgi:hypothetical protein